MSDPLKNGTHYPTVQMSPIERLMTDLAQFRAAMHAPQIERNLADRVLVACEWERQPDGVGHFRWVAPGGSLIMPESMAPHPLLRIDDALAIFPEGWMVVKMEYLRDASAWGVAAIHVRDGRTVSPAHQVLSVAIASAAVLAWIDDRERQ